MQKVARRCQGRVSDFTMSTGTYLPLYHETNHHNQLNNPKPNVTEHHNQLQSLCIAIYTEGLPEVATNKYKEKAAVATMITAAKLAKHHHN